jgi:4-hydroxybenzoyl-CoA thioesterase
MSKLTSTRTVRIQWGDCDPAGIIFYPRYFEIFDASTAILFERALGMTKHKYLTEYEFAGFPVVTNKASFFKPTRFGDDVTVESTVTFGTSSFSVRHRVSLGGELCAEGNETRVWVARDASGAIKPQPIPEKVRAKFS